MFLDDYSALALWTSGQPCSFRTRKSVFSGSSWLGLTTVGSALEAYWQASESSIPLSKKATHRGQGAGAEAEGLDQPVVGQLTTSS